MGANVLTDAFPATSDSRRSTLTGAPPIAPAASEADEHWACWPYRAFRVRYYREAWSQQGDAQTLASIAGALSAAALVGFGAGLRQTLRDAGADELASIAFAAVVIVAAGLLTVVAAIATTAAETRRPRCAAGHPDALGPQRRTRASGGRRIRPSDDRGRTGGDPNWAATGVVGLGIAARRRDRVHAGHVHRLYRDAGVAASRQRPDAAWRLDADRRPRPPARCPAPSPPGDRARSARLRPARRRRAGRRLSRRACRSPWAPGSRGRRPRGRSRSARRHSPRSG